MNYETWRIRGTPTPNHRLVVCDKCQEAKWYIYSPGIIYCSKGHGRLRDGTPKELKEATASITYEIG